MDAEARLAKKQANQDYKHVMHWRGQAPTSSNDIMHWRGQAPTSSNDIIKLETKLAKLMAYLSIPKSVIEDDPVEEEDDSSLSEVDKLIKENAKLKKMLGLA